MPELTLDLVLRLAVCFLIGSIPFAALAMAGSGVDIRKVGSGNPGFNNVLRVSKPRAIVCLIGDLGKGIVAILIFHRAGEPVTVSWLLGFAIVLGHCYSPFLRFHGGKGIATSAGVMLVIYPALAIPCVCSYVVLRIVGSRMKWRERGALASLSSWALFAMLLLFVQGAHQAALAAAMFAILAWRHRDNLKRLAGPATA